jgi:tetratricopeptide (TPR) repeat protein
VFLIKKILIRRECVFELPHGFLKYFKGFLMKKIVTFVILVIVLGFLGGCADKEEGKDQFEEAEYYMEKKDIKKAEKLLKESCSNDYAKGCVNLAYYVDKQNNIKAAVKHLKKAIKIKLKEDRDNKKRYEEWKEFSSEVDKACKDKESKDCAGTIAGALWFPF